jgi:hypothetical protein
MAKSSKTKTDEVKFFDSDTVSCIANLSLISEEEKDQLNTSAPAPVFNTSAQGRKLLHLIRREKPYLENRLEPADLERTIFVRGRNTNERNASQSGAFLLFGKDAVLAETGHDTLDLERVTIRKQAGNS